MRFKGVVTFFGAYDPAGRLVGLRRLVPPYLIYVIALRFGAKVFDENILIGLIRPIGPINQRDIPGICDPVGSGHSSTQRELRPPDWLDTRK